MTYLRVRHDDLVTWTWIVPLGLTALSELVFVMAGSPAFFGERGILTLMRDLIQLLIGFFVASLAAVSAFNDPRLEEPMKGEPPKLSELDIVTGKPKLVPLNRRKFLCLLFGYLALLSIVLYLAIMLGALAQPAIATQVSAHTMQWVRNIVAVLYFFLFWQMIATMLIGLYYLSYRLHRD